MQITYREAMPLDLPVLVSMERTLFADSPWSMGQFKEEFSGIPKTRYFIVAINSDKEIVGYAGVMVVSSGVDADVLTVAVLPEARRQGIARHFMDSLEKWAQMRVAPSMMLEVGVNNSSAIGLYESLGYSIINTRKNYYGPGLDAHVMRKRVAMSEPLVIGIETSCDETAIGIVRGRTLLANEIASSVQEHARFGGVVPEIASRAHLEAMIPALDRALASAKVSLKDIDAVAVTAGPGLVGALLVGTSTATALALALDKPIYGVNHLAAHISVDYLTHSESIDPTIALLVSGGHSSILQINDITSSVTSLGSTMDDAAGEAFDKIARVMGLGFPGGPAVDREAQSGDRDAINFPRGLTQAEDWRTRPFDFSFSGLKTAVARYLESTPLYKRANVAASFQEAIVDVLLQKSLAACKATGIQSMVIAGGVAANSRLRQLAEQRCLDAGVRLRIPSPILCTDNGAMVAALGSLMSSAGRAPSAIDFSATSSLAVTSVSV